MEPVNATLLEIQGPDWAYPIEIGLGLLDRIDASVARHLHHRDGGDCILVTDSVVGPYYAGRARTALERGGWLVSEHRIPSGEGSKSVSELAALFEFLAARRVARDGLIVALGGGVVSDLAGFAAACWMRGIPWVVVPTTLEAQIDASIGGKTAINIPGGKNLVGAFHQPGAVLIDPTCLRTLDPRDVRAGLAESIKHALISSDDFFAWHERNVDAILALDDTVLTELIERNVRIKANVVARDPFERTGERMMLNFGHTMGHAIEACCGYALRHGECVALGMLAACRMSVAMGVLESSIVDRIHALLSRFGLPTALTEPIPFERIKDTIARDKKARGKQVQWVLLESIGQTRTSVSVDERAVREAYESLLEAKA